MNISLFDIIVKIAKSIRKHWFIIKLSVNKHLKNFQNSSKKFSTLPVIFKINLLG